MNTLSYKTKSADKNSADKQWLVVDAKGQQLGRMASKVAKMLRGKHKPSFTPHADCGDNVIVLNAAAVELSGTKWTDKDYVRHTGFPGGQRFSTPEQLLAKKPCSVVEKAIKGMLPKNRLGRAIYGNLYVFEGEEHTHEAQKPKKIDLNEFN